MTGFIIYIANAVPGDGPSATAPFDTVRACISKFIEYGAAFRGKDENNRAPIFFPVLKNNVEMVELLLDSDLLPNAVGDNIRASADSRPKGTNKFAPEPAMLSVG